MAFVCFAIASAAAASTSFRTSSQALLLWGAETLLNGRTADKGALADIAPSIMRGFSAKSTYKMCWYEQTRNLNIYNTNYFVTHLLFMLMALRYDGFFLRQKKQGLEGSSGATPKLL